MEMEIEFMTFSKSLKRFCYLAALTCLLLAAASPLAAQVGGARIRGAVSDSSGALVPGAGVVLTHVSTGAEQRATTDESGNFSFVSLPVGSYHLSVEATGFRKYIRDGIVLEVDQRADVNVVLELGEVSETVTIHAEIARVDTQTPTLKQVIDRKRIEELPLNGRDAVELAALVAGAMPTGGRTNKQSSTLANQFYSVNGNRDNTVNFQMDGVDQNDPYTNAANPFPNPDALQEFSLQTSNFDAEFGRSSGAVMNVVTKSGTNQIHGSAFEFYRSGGLNARNYFSSSSDSLKRNQFGGSVGGPIVKNRTFFFTSYQGTRLSQAPTSGLSFAPTEAQRRGNLSSLGKTIVDPDTGIPFQGGVIPTSRLDPGIQKMLDELVPLPNTPDGRVSFSLPRTTDDNQIVTKIDQMLTSSQRLSVRYFYYNLDTPSVAIPGNFFATRNGFDANNHNLSVNHTATLSPQLVNSFDFGFSRLFTDQPVPISAAVSDFGSNIYTGEPKTLSVSVSGYFGLSSSNPVPNRRQSFQLKNSTSYSYGSHLLKWGAELRRTEQEWSTIFTLNGGFGFSGQLSGDALADYLLGRPSSFSQSSPLEYDGRHTAFNMFVQDNIKVNSRLTVDLGVRYEPYWPVYFVDDKIAQFRESAYNSGEKSQVFANAPKGLLFVGDRDIPRGGTKGYFKSFSPRAGAALDLTGDGLTVLRAGYGLFWDVPKMIMLNRFTTTQPFSVSVAIPSPPSFRDPYAGRQNPFPGVLDPSTDVQFIQPLALTITWPEQYIPSSTQQWNLTFERMLGKNLLRAAYVGTKGTHLNWSREINSAVYTPGQSTLANTDQRRPFYPEFSSMGRMFQDGNSIYHGMQLTLERRLTSFSTLINYTFSKSIDTNSDSVEVAIDHPLDLANLGLERGLSRWDAPHNFVASFLWELPIGRTGSAPLDAIVRNWQVNGIISLRSGSPFSVFTGLDRQFNGRSGERADLILANPTLDSSRPSGQLINEYFNTAAFALNPIGAPGTSGRNIIRGPGDAIANLSVMKIIPFREQMSLQLRGEFFNALNRPNFDFPNSTLGSPLFGKILSAGDPRIIQLGARFVF